jgi:DNA modification methylase
MSQPNLNISTKATGPVECLGQSFASEEVRREHYLKLLAQKLKDPEFRKIEGFPIGTDEDILALSDPPYYTACPNPWMGEFIKGYGTPYDPKQPYHREPFAADVSEGKNHPIYNAHSYHTKVPHRAIMRYILHYTQPGDVVFDGFCGTGMTGVAAQLCGDRTEVHALGYRVQNDGAILNEEGKAFSKLGSRRGIVNDLSPAATFISRAYNLPPQIELFEKVAKVILAGAESEFSWMFQTLHKPTPQTLVGAKALLATSKRPDFSNVGSAGRINYVVWSDILTCSECAGDVVFWDAAVDRNVGKVRDEFACPSCGAMLTKRTAESKFVKCFDKRLGETVKRPAQRPAYISYTFASNRYEKSADEVDVALAELISESESELWFPSAVLPDGDKMGEPRNAGLTHVHHFYTERNLQVIARFRSYGASAWAPFSALTPRATKMHRIAASRIGGEKQGVGGATVGIINGTLYVPSLSVEMNVLDQAVERIRLFGKAIIQGKPVMVTTGSTTNVPGLPDNSLDYIFIDPPFGANLMYSELNYLWEAWLKVFTNNKKEAIENKTQGKSTEGYRTLMTECFREMYRKLKPGRWATIEFSNTQASVWNGIQSALQEAGFVVANVSALDKQQGSFNAVTNTTSVKQDLVISAYKPNGGLEERFAKRGETEEGAWDFTRTHLKNLPVVKAKGGQMEPIAERDPRILYDRMVAFYVGHSTPVPLSSAEFQAGLAESFPERDGMFFLPEQVNEYDKKRAQVENIGQLSIFVEDERSAINWLRSFLKDRPSVSQDIQPEFMQQLSASWKKWEARPEMSALLDQNFLCYDGTGEVPSQIHAYLSTQFKELRNLPKDSAQLKNKAKNRWYVPDPKKNVDVETLRNKRLLEEFWSYLPEGYTHPALSANKGQTLPGLTVQRPKIPKGKKLRELRTEAVRVGFKHCYQQKDYTTILVVAEMIPDSLLNEDEQLQMIYDTAVTRTGEGR